MLLYVPQQAKQLSKKDKEEGKQAWKTKHLTHWRRGTITAKLSSATYEVQDYNGKTFVRSISLLKEDKSIITDATLAQAQDDTVEESSSQYPQGTMLAIRSTDRTSETAEIGRVERALESGEYWVHYYGTTDGNPSTAKFKPAWHDVQNRVTLAFKKPSKEIAWAGPIWDDLIIGEVHFKGNNATKLSLDEASIQLLENNNIRLNPMKTLPSKKRKVSEVSQNSTSAAKRRKSKRN